MGLVVPHIDTDVGVLKPPSYLRDLLVIHNWIFGSNKEIVATVFLVKECAWSHDAIT